MNSRPRPAFPATPFALAVGVACLCLRAGATVLEVPVITPTKDAAELINSSRQISIRDADLSVSVKPEQGLVPKAQVDFKQVFSDRAAFTYGTQLGLQGLPSETESSFSGDVALRLSVQQRFALDWRSASRRWHSNIAATSDENFSFEDTARRQRNTGSFETTYGASTGNYTLQLRTAADMQQRLVENEDQFVGFGWSKGLKELPVSLDFRPSFTSRSSPADPSSTTYTPRYETGLNWDVDGDTRLRFGSRGQQELDHLGILNSQSQFLFSSVDWRITGASRLRVETQVGARDEFSAATAGPLRREEFQVKASPRFPLRDGLDAQLDFLFRAEREPTRLWSPSEQSIYFSLGGHW